MVPQLICYSTADWDNPLWTNKQHLMSRLAARGVPVLYVDSLGLRRPSAAGRDLRRMLRRLWLWRPFARPIAGNLWRDSPLVIPLQRPLVRRINQALLAARLRRNRRRWRVGQAVLWTYSPSAVHLHDPSWHSLLVYHCVDVLTAQPGFDPGPIDADEARLIRRADVCIASSRPLLRRLVELGARDPLYWPNPADTAAYSAARRRSDPGRRVIGFVGAVQEHKVDMELIADCARAFPDCEFQLVGPVGGIGHTSIDPRGYAKNIRFVGTKAREELPDVVASFDVALIPYLVNRYTEHVFPMKVFEYLGAGVPVVSTPLPSLVGEVDHVSFATRGVEFVECLRRVLAETPGSPEDRSQRIAYAAAHSWGHRTDEALALLGDHVLVPGVDGGSPASPHHSSTETGER